MDKGEEQGEGLMETRIMSSVGHPSRPDIEGPALKSFRFGGASVGGRGGAGTTTSTPQGLYKKVNSRQFA